MRTYKYFLYLTALVLAVGCSSDEIQKKAVAEEKRNTMSTSKEIATLGGGCFWCVEAVFQSLKGVSLVESGYMGGTVKNPTYQEVSSGETGHAEVAQLTFDPTVISFEDILRVFFHAHDPTTLNRQGADEGTQYRSAIFYHTPEQEVSARKIFDEITAKKLWNDKIVTEITPASEFYIAENYHQNYYTTHQGQPYCSIVIAPKLQKIYKEFADKIKREKSVLP